MRQEQKERKSQPRKVEETDVEEAPVTEDDEFDRDALLDEIDEVLETIDEVLVECKSEALGTCPCGEDWSDCYNPIRRHEAGLTPMNPNLSVS